MPLRNRVTPFGEIIADPARGLLLGNRGCLHRDGRIVRHHANRRWIACRLEWKGARRALQQPGRWTELFFLDEATALAAGHRPCAYCRRGDYDRYRAAWARAAGTVAPGADHMDDALHGERVRGRDTKVTFPAAAATLPDGAFVTDGDVALLVHGGVLRPWHPGGYGPALAPPVGPLVVLTPRSTVAAIRAGYTPAVHPSAAVA